LFRTAGIPARLMPAAIVLGTSTFTMSALPGTPSIQNAIPMPFFGTTPFAAPGLGVLASLVMFGFGMWWLGREEARAKGAREISADTEPPTGERLAADEALRERATTAREFDPAEIARAKTSETPLPFLPAVLPLVVVVSVNFVMSMFVLPLLDTSFLSEARWGQTSLAAVGGVWAVITALVCAILAVLAINYRRLPAVRETMDAGANASVLPAMSVASLVGFGAVVAAVPAFGIVRDAVLGIEGGPLVSLAIATNVLAAMTGSASGGLTIALDALAGSYIERAADIGLAPALLHRVAVIAAGTLDTLPHNGAVITLLAVCGSTHRESYRDIVIVGIIGPIMALAAIIVLGSTFGSF
jgi:H+/gluconate symporter-like permease